MLFSLDQAPLDTPLRLADICDSQLAEWLSRLGVDADDRLLRLDEVAAAGAVRIAGPNGEVVLGSGMAAKVIVHHDDGHKTPVIEMHSGETGHVEGLVGGSALAEGLAVMGITERSPITLIRHLPPMNYQARLNQQRIMLTEGTASKIWGQMNGRAMQFVMAGYGLPFKVSRLLAGRGARNMLENLSIGPGTILILEDVSPAPGAGLHHRDQIVIAMQSGLRLYLRPDQARQIQVINNG